MARNRDRQFSESENLKLRMDREAAQAEERVSHWAGLGEEEKAERPSYWTGTQEDTPAYSDTPSQTAASDQQDVEAATPAGASRPVAQGPAVRQAGPATEEKADADEAADDEEEPWETARRQADAAWERHAARSKGASHAAVPEVEQEDEEDEAAGSYEDTKTTAQRYTEPERRKAPPRPPKPKKKSREDDERSFFKRFIIFSVCFFLFAMVALMVISNFVSHPLLALPRKWVTSIVTPVQNAFSSVTDSVVEYLRTLKVRGEIEYRYELAISRIDELETDMARMQELEYENSQLQDLLAEHKNHEQLNPIGATVIGHDSGNYFSTLTLNVGSNQGVAEYMAVVSAGGLVGVTYGVEENKCQVRCIINSDSTVAALVQSSRDQGSVKGTFGTNGEAMCRMYYLPDNSLPRPGDVVVTSGVGLEFPKGIPIGYIRESTRGMDENKAYVVLEPVVDFRHLEYVTVYRYKPAYAEKAQVREDNMQLSLVSAPTIVPVPTFSLGEVSDFIFGGTATPGPETPTLTPTATTTPTPPPTATPDPNATAVPDNLEYVPNLPYDVTPTPSPRPTFTPVPTAAPTQNPGGMTMEEGD